MENTPGRQADGAAERIVRHFQAQGFAGISEALILRICLRNGDRVGVDAAFETAVEHGEMPPVHQCFQFYAVGHFSDSRTFEEARSNLQSDFGAGLRIEVPRVFFDPAPVVIDDALATGTKYDAMLKLLNNIEDSAFVILLNDPDSSFLEYIGTHHGNDWQKIMGDFGETIVSLDPELDLLA